jgi:hypothetical protein
MLFSPHPVCGMVPEAHRDCAIQHTNLERALSLVGGGQS